MNNDIIKLLNLESYNIDLDKSILIKNENGIEYVIVLNKSDVSCPKCGCIECTIHVKRLLVGKRSISVLEMDLFLDPQLLKRRFDPQEIKRDYLSDPQLFKSALKY